ncbi:MAG: hypothetical protein EOP83_36305 [Verrucomicrobiaceae bacterium]|nr:MAG: hypothetical protein EOP83_36305 [Verrucomicrobiaceae bacterium]
MAPFFTVRLATVRLKRFGFGAPPVGVNSVPQGTARTGTEFTPTGGAPKPNLFSRTVANLTVKNGATSAFGSEATKTGTFKSGTTTTTVQLRTENYNITGKAGTGVGIVTGSYRTAGAKAANLATLLPLPAVAP